MKILGFELENHLQKVDTEILVGVEYIYKIHGFHENLSFVVVYLCFIFSCNYLQVITYQKKQDPNYQDIATKLSKNMLELEDIIKDIRKYNLSNKDNPLIHIINK